jgi:hypothetical protein
VPTLLGGLGEVSRGRLLPRLSEAVAVEKPEDSRDQQQDGFIERAWEGCYAHCAAPPQWSGDAAVADDDVDGAKCVRRESACGSHAASLGRDLLGGVGETIGETH